MWQKFLNALGFQQTSAGDLALETKNQALRLDLAETRQKLAVAQSELVRQNEQHEKKVNELGEVSTQKLFTDLGGPLVQLQTQIYLDEIEHQPIRAEDILRVVKSLLRILENRGLQFFGQISSSTTFDPDYHNPLSAETEIVAGTPVLVRIPGVSYQDRVLVKAGVSLVEPANKPDNPQE